MERHLRQIRRLLDQERWDDAARAAERALPAARGHGMQFEGLVRLQLGIALLRGAKGSNQVRIERAIVELKKASRKLPAGFWRAEALVDLGVGMAQRSAGDPNANLDAAIESFGAAIRQINPREHAETWATARTNLAHALRRRGSDGLDAALEHARAAVAARSPSVDADSWAYAQTNLADVLATTARRDSASLAEAIAAWAEITERVALLKDKSIAGNAYLALADIAVTEADGLERQDATQRARERWREARRYVQQALLLTGTGGELLHGRALSLLGRVRIALGDRQGAVGDLSEAVRLLRPTNAPRECRDAAWRLGYVLYEERRWTESAAAFRLAVEAADIAYDSRIDVVGLRSEAAGAWNLSRLAASAALRAGDAEAAVALLDNGRAREVSQAMGAPDDDLRRLEQTSEKLYAAYMDALGVVPGARSSSLRQSRGDLLADTLARIRALPGLAGFGRSKSFAEVLAAVEPGAPLAYVSPTPDGTMLLVVAVDVCGQASVSSAYLNDPHGQATFLTLMAGDYEGVLANGSNAGLPPSYIAAASAAGEDEAASRDVAAALDYVLPWFGTRVARPLSEMLLQVGASRVTLIPCGPIAMAPLHAAMWHTKNEPECLLDHLVVQYAPSATIHAASLRRAAGRAAARPQLVAVANPSYDLPASEAEVTELERLFGGGVVAKTENATVAFLKQHAASADYLHLACHAQTNPVDLATTGVSMADGTITLEDLSALGRLPARLVTASACQTAIQNIDELADEAFSVGTGFMAAGSACVVASLWSVDDMATALLMVRMYEQLLGSAGLRPPEALRQAQLWLRGLTTAEESAFLANHEALQHEFDFRIRNGRPPGRREPSRSHHVVRPYAHPDYWAGFIALGS